MPRDRNHHNGFLRRTWMSLAFRQELELLRVLPSWSWHRFRWGGWSLAGHLFLAENPQKTGKFHHMYPFPEQGFHGNPFGKFDSGASEFFYWEDVDSSCNVYPWNNSGVVVISDFFWNFLGYFFVPLRKNKKFVTKLATKNWAKHLWFPHQD